MTLNRLFTCFVLASIPVCASALAPADFTLAPGLSARLVSPAVALNTEDPPQTAGYLANGALLLAEGAIPAGLTLKRLNDNGTVDFLATIVSPTGNRIGFVPDTATGCIWVVHYVTNDVYEYWKIEGLPRTLGTGGGCPSPPGDLAPGTMDNGTNPPTWRVIGDSAVDISDVVTVLRAAVGLQTIACPP